MASKLILVPEEVYRGLTSSDTGNINLDFTRKLLERAKREKSNASTKNIHYNQALARYLKLREEFENKPTKVELAKGMRALIRRADDSNDEEEIEVEFNPSRAPRRRRQPRQLNIQREIVPAQPEQERIAHPSPPPPPPIPPQHPPPMEIAEGPSNQQQPRRRAGRPVVARQRPNRSPPRPSPTKRRRQPEVETQNEGSNFVRKQRRIGVLSQNNVIDEADEWLTEDEDEQQGVPHPPPLDQRPSTSAQANAPPSLDQRPSTSAQANAPPSLDQRPSTSAQANAPPSSTQEDVLLNTPIPRLNVEGLVRRFHIWLNRNQGKYNVKGDVILDGSRNPINGSSLERSLRYIIEKRENRGIMLRKRPPGTYIIEDRINRDDILSSWISPILGKRKLTEGESQSEQQPRSKSSSLRPRRWNLR